MLVPAENFPAPHQQGFKKAVAKKKAAVENRHDGLFLRHKFAIQKNNHTVAKCCGCSCNAAKNPPALAMVSSYSPSATESATMPAPTWKWISPARQTAVRMAMLSWLSRLKPR